MKKYQNGGMAAIPKAGKKNLTPSTGTATDNLSASMAKRNTAAPNKKAMDSAKANMKTGGATKKYQNGGPADAMRIQQGQKVPTTKETMNYVRKNGSGYKSPSEGAKATRPANKGYQSYKDAAIKRYGSEEKAREVGAMKTGGMVNPNAKLQAAKSAGSKGVKSGVNPKAAASKVAKGRSGGTSAAPKTALPKAQYGGKPTLLKPANNPLADKPTKSLAYRDGVKPADAAPKTGQYPKTSLKKAQKGMAVKTKQKAKVKIKGTSPLNLPLSPR